jgi:large subunit ribosomal protein L13
VVNAKQVQVSGNKRKQKLYRHHTGWPGGLKEIPFDRLMENKPDEVTQPNQI